MDKVGSIWRNRVGMTDGESREYIWRDRVGMTGWIK